MHPEDSAVALRQADPAALLVEPRVLRRVIKRHCKLSGIGLQVPHSHCYTLGRDELYEIASRAELDAPNSDGGDELPERIILLARPDTDEGGLLSLWRLLFHARVHQAFEDKALTPASIRERIHRVGQTEFDEIRFVLRQEDLLLPPHDDRQTYVEFAALYLELRHFAPQTMARTFPTLEDLGAVDATLALDLDAAALLARCRPAGAPESPLPAAAPAAPDPAAVPRPTAAPTGRPDPEAERARAKGNLVRAALRCVGAGDETGARADLEKLGARLEAALGAASPSGAAWAPLLLPLAQAGESRHGLRRIVEVRLLYDLQKACLSHEREVHTVDAVEWALTLGKRPLVRSLPAGHEVRIAKQLHRASEKLAGLRHIRDDERARLSRALHEAVARADAQVREKLRPRLAEVLTAVGLVPANLPERIARKKLVEELLDQIVDRGYLNIGHLRDAISGNQLKLDNLSLREFFKGDELLQANRKLSRSLDGVYRRGEIYLRGLQKLSSLTSGTRVGRFLTLYAILPLLGAFLLLEGLQHIVGPLFHAAAGWEPELMNSVSFVLTSVYLFALLHSARVRAASRDFFRTVGRDIKIVAIDVPRWLWRRPLVQRVVTSGPFRLLARYLLKPLAFTWEFYFLAPIFNLQPRTVYIIGGAAFLAFNLLLNSPAGATIEEIAGDWAVRSGRQLRQRILPGLVRLLADVFHSMLEAIDRFIYAVDEFLRFRRGEHKATLIIKAVLGVAWALVTYLLRVYVNLLLEPEINPLKHFPVVTVAAKIMLPISPPLVRAMRTPLLPLGTVFANSFATLTVFLLPGVAGFLAWELRGNWRLYRANRHPTLGAVAIGHHGETMVGFMKPGFHSGTIPKLYGKMRRAAWKGAAAAAKHREALHHVEHAIRHFALRELSALLAEAESWTSGPVTAGEITIGSNRLRIELLGPGEPALLSFEEQSGWLLASLPRAGWINGLADGQRAVLENALAGFYKLAGVDLVREQIEAVLGGRPSYDIADEGLVVWPGHYKTELVYDLETGLHADQMIAQVRGEPAKSPPAALSSQKVLFVKQAIAWTDWVLAWSGESRRLIGGPSLLPAVAAQPESLTMRSTR